MSNLKISELADGGAAQASDKLPVARSGLNYYITNQYLKNFVFGSTGKVDMSAGVTLTVTRTLTMPTDDGTSGYVLATDGAGNTYWTAGGGGGGGSGDVTGPASATDNAIARFNGTTGKIIQNSAVTIADTTGDITGGKYNGLTVSTTTGTLTIANGKTLSVDNTLTFTGTDGSTLGVGAGGTLGSLAFKSQAAISTDVSGLGTGIATALAVNTGSTGAPVLFNGALGTPTSGTLSSCSGLPAATGIANGALPSGVTINNANWSGTALSVTNGGTGTSSPGLVAGTNITITGTWPNQTISAAGGGGSMVYPGAGIAYSTGSAWGTSYTTSGSGTVLALTTSPTFTTPALGTPSSGTLTNCTNLPVGGIDATGTPSASTYLRGDGSWATVSGTGDVVGPASATDNAIVRFDGTTGKLIQNSAVTVADTTGDITGGKYNKVTVTAPATGATLTLADNSTFTTVGAYGITLTSTGATNVTLPTSGTLLAGTVAITDGGTGQTSQQTAINALAGAVTDGYFLRGNGTNVVMNSIQVSDVPTLNQNTTGTAANVTGTVAVANGGTGVSSAGITAFANITGYPASGATGTTSTNLVFSTSPTLVTPTLGVASATSINKVAITAPATSATLTIADGKTLTASNSITLAGTDSTTMTFPSTSSTIAAAGKQTIWVPAAAMYKRTTNGAAYSTSEIATNFEMLSYFAFDSITAEYVQFNVHMPKSWNEGTVIAQFVWTHPATTTNFGVNWNIQGYAFSDGDNISAAFGTAQNIDDTGGNTSYCYISAETSAITIGGTPAQNDWVVFQAYRNPAATNDTMAVDAYLLGVKIIYTTDAPNDN